MLVVVLFCLFFNLLLLFLLFFSPRYLVSIGCIKPLCSMLTMPDSRVILVTLEGLENILKVGQQDLDKNGGINPHSVLIEEAYGE